MKNKLEKIVVKDFQGIKGEKTIHLNKITALCAPNGYGKSSFINSLIFGLTGNKPNGTIVNNNSDHAKVSLKFKDSHNFTRIEGADSSFSNAFYLDDKKTTKKQLEDYLSLELNTDMSVAKAVTSSEVLNSLSNQEFGSLLMKYLPEELDKDLVLKYFQNSDTVERDIVLELLPDGNFPLSELDNLYDKLYERRKILKQEISKYSSVITDFYNKKKPENALLGIDVVDQKIAELQSQRDIALKLDSQLKNYQNYLKTLDNYNKQINSISQQIDDIKADFHDQNGLDILENAVKTNYETLDNLNRLLAQSQSDISLYENGLKNLNQPMCPLSSNLVCTTDKTPVRDDIIENLEGSKAIHAQTYNSYVELKERTDGMQEQLKLYIAENNEYQKKEMLYKQLEDLKNNPPIAVEKPSEPEKSLAQIDQELFDLNNVKMYLTNLEQIKTYQSRLEEYNDKLDHYEYLVSSFSPKGSVRKLIMEYYMDAFSEPCNEKANELFDGMKIKFVADKGVEVFADIDASGNYIPYKSLSNGEKASVTFLLMDMLSKLSGMNIIILDELSVLDPETFDKLIDLVIKNQDEYDLCVLACVNHKDNIEILDKYNIDTIGL